MHLHPAFSVLPRALSAWMHRSLSETLLQLRSVSGQCTWQDQDQLRTRVGAKPRQGMEDGE